MKTARYLPHLSFFGIFLLFGFWAGQRIGNSSKQEQQTNKPIKTWESTHRIHSGEATPTVTPALEATIPVPDIHPTEKLPEESDQGMQQLPVAQRNLLVIGVDDLSAIESHLESIWLIIYRPDTPHFMFVPIYPTPQGEQTETDSINSSLPDLFKLDERKALQPEFLVALEEINFLWTDYIIMDKVALSDVVEFLGRAGEKSGLDGASTVSSIPPALLEPQESLMQQAKLIQDLCLSVTSLTLEDHWRLPLLFDLIPDHVITSVDLDTIANEWQSQLVQVRAVKCEFPSLGGTPAHP